MRRVLGPVVFALGVACASSCRTAAPQPADQRATTATLSVENHTFSDQVIYVVTGGMPQRLGIASAERTTKLTIPRADLTASPQLRFLARPIGGNGGERSERITVYPGDDVAMIIEGE
ncbi:MAG: hypothetical protein ACREN3_15470 [Gemmatimonadaceae bacterium]